MKYVVSWSGGKDSTYMLFELLRRGLPVDEVVCVDTTISLDHLEMIIASAKLEAAREIFHDFRFLLRLGRDGGLGAQPPD